MGSATRALGGLAVSAVLVASTMAADAGPARAASPGGTIHLSPPVRRADVTLPPGPIPLDGLVGRYVQFTVDASATPGTVQFGACGTEIETILHFDTGATQSSLQFISEGTCASVTTTARVILDDFGYDGAEDDSGLRYFGLDSSVEVRGVEEPVGTGEIPLPLDDLVPADADGVAVQVRGYTLEGVGSAAVHECGSPVPSLPHVPLNSAVLNENVAFVTLNPAAGLCLYVDAPGRAEVGLTVHGYFTDAAEDGGHVPPTLVFTSEPAPGFVSRPPLRVLDTRLGIGAPAGKVAAGSTIELDLAGLVTDDTSAVVMNVTAADTDGWGYVTVFACDVAQPATSNVNFDAAGQNVPNQVTVDVSAQGTVCLFASAGTHLLADVAGSYEYGGGQRFTALDPVRILDTRSGTGAAGRVDAGQTLTLQVTGHGGVPAEATAVTVNLTAVDPLGWGYITAYPCDAPRPEASNINHVPGQTVPNLVTVQLSAAGTVCLFSYAGADLVADVAGFYDANPAGAGLVTYSPLRLWDTRDDGEMLDWQYYYPLSITGDETAADAGIPAVIVNLTVTEPLGAGYLTAYPCTDEFPDASNVNFEADQTVANLAVVKLSPFGELCISSYDFTHAIVDLFGAFTTGDVWYQFPRVDV